MNVSINVVLFLVISNFFGDLCSGVRQINHAGVGEIKNGECTVDSDFVPVVIKEKL